MSPDIKEMIEQEQNQPLKAAILSDAMLSMMVDGGMTASEIIVALVLDRKRLQGQIAENDAMLKARHMEMDDKFQTARHEQQMAQLERQERIAAHKEKEAKKPKEAA